MNTGKLSEAKVSLYCGSLNVFRELTIDAHQTPKSPRVVQSSHMNRATYMDLAHALWLCQGVIKVIYRQTTAENRVTIFDRGHV
jgi:hypothetical protein